MVTIIQIGEYVVMGNRNPRIFMNCKHGILISLDILLGVFDVAPVGCLSSPHTLSDLVKYLHLAN